jgi:hypothetical protein
MFIVEGVEAVAKGSFCVVDVCLCDVAFCCVGEFGLAEAVSMAVFLVAFFDNFRKADVSAGCDRCD